MVFAKKLDLADGENGGQKNGSAIESTDNDADCLL